MDQWLKWQFTADVIHLEVGRGWERGMPPFHPTTGLGSFVSFPGGVQGKALAENEFDAFYLL